MSLDLAMSLRIGTKHGKHGGGPPAYTGPLDLTATPAVVAYGQRALSAAKLGTALITIADGAGGATHVFNSDAVTGASPDAAIQLYSAMPFVAGWTDQSGNGSHAAQAAGANQPQWLANQFVTVAGLSFDHTAPQFLATSANVSLPNGAYTVFGVIIPTTLVPVGATSASLCGANYSNVAFDNAAFSVYALYPPSGSNQLVEDAFSASGTNEAGGRTEEITNPLTTGIAYIAEFAWTTGNHNILLNGASFAVTSIFDSGATVGTIDDLLAVGAEDAGAQFQPWNGVIAELLIFPLVLSSADRTAIRQNIATWYGITLS